MRKIIACLLLAFAVGATAGVAGTRPAAAQSTETVLQVVFTEIERQLIRDYYRDLYGNRPSGGGQGSQGKNKGKKGDLPPGFQKKVDATGQLPPGLQKQIEETGRLPPGLEKRALPGDLVSRLPLRPDHERVIVGSDVYLIRRGTQIVLDILRGVLN